MISRIWALALNSYREAVRQKILYTLVFFAAVLILGSLFLGQLTLGADLKIIKDMGLFSIMLFGALISIFMGVGMVFKEVDRRTIYTILSKPVTRYEFILGKFAGLAFVVTVQVAAMTALWYGLMSLYPPPLDFTLLKAVSLIHTELMVLVAATLVFSSYSSSFMSTMFCLSFLVIGHLTDDLVAVARPQAYILIGEGGAFEVAAGHVLNAVVSVIGLFSLDRFVINAEVVHGVPVPAGWVLHGLGYGVLWIALLLTLAIALFRRKDLQ